MQLYYINEELPRAEAILRTTSDNKDNDNDLKAFLRCAGLKSTWEYGGAGWHYIAELRTRQSRNLPMDTISTMHTCAWVPTYAKLPEEVRELVEKKFSNYEKHKGTKHPRWGEFS